MMVVLGDIDDIRHIHTFRFEIRLCNFIYIFIYVCLIKSRLLENHDYKKLKTTYLVI